MPKQITDVNHALIAVTGIQRNLIGTDFSIYFTEPEEQDKLIFKYLNKVLFQIMP
jgi:hypothetical protein